MLFIFVCAQLLIFDAFLLARMMSGSFRKLFSLVWRIYLLLLMVRNVRYVHFVLAPHPRSER